jgi:hypothetical protein
MVTKDGTVLCEDCVVLIKIDLRSKKRPVKKVEDYPQVIIDLDREDGKFTS